MHLKIDKKKAVKKWAPIMESLGIKDVQNGGRRQDQDKYDWLPEYAEYHSIHENVGATGVGYATLGNLNGMGGVVSPTVGALPGMGGAGYNNAGLMQGAGSGDIGQQLLPMAMKVAAQTIGLDLVAVKPSPGPVIDLMYIDYQYDGGGPAEGYNPVVFKINAEDLTALKFEIDAAVQSAGAQVSRGGVSKKIFFGLPAGATRGAGAVGPNYSEPAGTKEGVVEFLGYSRIDGLPMFRAFRATNTASYGSWQFDQTRNTFEEGETIKEAFERATGGAGTGDALIGDLTGVTVELISALEDHLIGFSSGFHRNGPMTRAEDEVTYPNVIAPQVFTKRVQIGSIEVSAALKRTEIEDIKAQTGIDIVQKLESVLINELSQTISREIVYKLFELGNQNRLASPTTSGVAPYNTVFDFDVSGYFGGGSAPGGETTQSAQRKLLTKIQAASHYIAVEGRVGPAQFIVTNAKMAAVLSTAAGYGLSPTQFTVNPNGQLYPQGTIGDLQVYVDPYMGFNDDRILVGRKNNPDQPGVIFVPYLMAQSVKLISEATFAPRILLRSRYAITEVGFYPQKQYITINVNDPAGMLA